MNHTTRQAAFATGRWFAAVPLAMVGATAFAQGSESASGDGLAATPSPYYIGASQALTHDSNAYNVPFGPSDNYSSTSLLAAFDQPISRQRLFGTANISINRYQDQTRLNNTSYDLSTGIDWQTIWKLSGSLTANLDQRLVAPSASVDNPATTRNLERRNGINGLARWGGDALLTLESRFGYSTLDYSASEYVSSESKNGYASLGLFYRPGSLLRVGLAGRFDETRNPKSIQLVDGSFVANETKSRNLDLLADYNNASNITASGRLSYTRQTNTSVNDADFSGLTGSLNVSYRATGKIGVNVFAARDAGFNSASGTYGSLLGPTGGSTNPAGGNANLYENNKVTNTAGIGASYAATAKISVNANARYSRGRIISSSAVSDSANSAEVDVVDETRGASISANYEYSRSLNFACNYARDRRVVSGAVSYAYTDSLTSCSARFLWR